MENITTDIGLKRQRFKETFHWRQRISVLMFSVRHNALGLPLVGPTTTTTTTASCLALCKISWPRGENKKEIFFQLENLKQRQLRPTVFFLHFLVCSDGLEGSNQYALNCHYRRKPSGLKSFPYLPNQQIDFSVAINTHLKTISLNPQKFNLTTVTFMASFEKTKEQLRRVVLVWGKGEGEGGLLGAILCTILLPFLFAKGGYRNCQNRKDLLKAK